jgi:cyclophilin family peptidyl-prolyl cis-trans isomerase
LHKRLILAALPAVVALQMGGCPTLTDTPPVGVRVDTSLGSFVIELDATAAPVSTANFLRYVGDGFYNGTIFHRVIPGFVVQGGGFTPDLREKTTRPAIVNESLNGRSNVRASVAMARTDEPDSATAQFYVNVVDNIELDATDQRLGYAVFGTVIEGMDVVDRIAAVQTETRDELSDIPVEDVVIERIEVIDLSAGNTLTDDDRRRLEQQVFSLQTLIRDVIVQALSFAIPAAF